MNENFFEAQYDVTKKSKLKKFYEANKILIFLAVLIIIIASASVSFYSETKEKKKNIFVRQLSNSKSLLKEW